MKEGLSCIRASVTDMGLLVSQQFPHKMAKVIGVSQVGIVDGNNI